MKTQHKHLLSNYLVPKISGPNFECLSLQLEHVEQLKVETIVLNFISMQDKVVENQKVFEVL